MFSSAFEMDNNQGYRSLIEWIGNMKVREVSIQRLWKFTRVIKNINEEGLVQELIRV